MVKTIKRYEIFCYDHGTKMYKWQENPLTVCPENPEDKVNMESINLNFSVTFDDVFEINSETQNIGKSCIYSCDTENNNITLYLPELSKSMGNYIYIEKISENNILEIVPISGETIQQTTGSLSITGLNTIMLLNTLGDDWQKEPTQFYDSKIANTNLNTFFYKKGNILIGSEITCAPCVVELGNNDDILTIDTTQYPCIKWINPSINYNKNKTQIISDSQTGYHDGSSTYIGIQSVPCTFSLVSTGTYGYNRIITIKDETGTATNSNKISLICDDSNDKFYYNSKGEGSTSAIIINRGGKLTFISRDKSGNNGWYLL